MNSLIEKIAAIGRRMVDCRGLCEGVRRDQAAGIPPRCLIYESEKRTSGIGCAVIGINPGNAEPDEIRFYRANGISYESNLRYWNQSLGYSHSYYTRTRSLLDQVGLTGPILWTELAKCEGASKSQKVPPLRTLRYCAGQYLLEELQLIPDWPLIALGREAHKALSYMFPRRTIIGVPHPSGMGRIHFFRIMPNGILSERAKSAIKMALMEPPGEFVWISEME